MTATTESTIPLTQIPVSPRDQTMADTLTDTMINDIVHHPETLTVSLHTTMKPGEGKAHCLALIQVLHKFGLASMNISALMVRGILEEGPFNDSIYIPWDTDDIGRTIALVVHGSDISLSLSGTPPKRGKDGELTHTFFIKGSNAGKILADGRIDFRELHRYPSAKPGDCLLRVSLPENGKNGLSHAGDAIETPTVKEYPLQLGKNVERVYIISEKGQPGYDINALTEGVVITQMEEGKITAIHVNDHIVVGDINFSIGNIGSDVICPVSMQAESINEGFTVKVEGAISVRTIDGGRVSSGKKATVDQMLAGSALTAGGDISCRSIASSTLRAMDNTVFIHREAIDSTITASRIEMNTAASLLLNTQLNTYTLDLRNIRISGTNRVILAPDLFSKRETRLKEWQRATTIRHDMNETLNQTKADLVVELKSLSAEFGEDTTIRLVFKAIVKALKTYDFDKLPKLMALLKRGNTCLAVGRCMRIIEHLKSQLKRFWKLDARTAEIKAEIDAMEQRLESIAFTIHARFRPSATMDIHLGTKEALPLVLSPPSEKNEDHTLHIKGKYSLKKGLIITERSG